jgi:hypothetical protein
VSRNFGFEVEREYKMYTLQEFNDGCHINLIMGGFAGSAFTIVAALLFFWAHGWF